jgi:hypothetical protein
MPNSYDGRGYSKCGSSTGCTLDGVQQPSSQLDDGALDFRRIVVELKIFSPAC